MFVLLLAALSSFAGPAGAQPDPLQLVVIYVEFKPADTKAGGRLLDDLASQGLASAGAAVAVNGRNAESTEAAAQAIVAGGGASLAVTADISKASDVETLVQKTIERFFECRSKI